MGISKVEIGEIFYAFNKDMHKPKTKYHLCLGEKYYFVINTQSHTYDLEITPEDCPLLSYNSYIKCDQLFVEPIENFTIIRKEELSINALNLLIEKVKLSPTLTGMQIKNIVALLENCLMQRQSENLL